jgi:uncharacterized protein
MSRGITKDEQPGLGARPAIFEVGYSSICSASLASGAVSQPRPVHAANLPIFRWDCPDYSAFYAPGCLCVVDPGNAEQFEDSISSSKRQSPADGRVDWGAELWLYADLAVTRAAVWRQEPFCPECLTLYMNNECNLSCVYCHTDPSPRTAIRLDMETLSAAAELVAESCRRKGHPFYAVFHGGGEPTLHRRRVEEAMALIQAAAAKHGVELFRYVATNGVMPEEKATWLTRRFDLIGLSCDGPVDIHDRQRPRWDGSGTLGAVERTARILRQEDCPFHVRTTITRSSLSLQREIAEYICQQLSPEEIHFEPVYVGKRVDASAGLGPDHAEQFAVHFIKARAVARRYGIPLLSSGSRLNTIHGPYCNVFRNVLNLVPGGNSADPPLAVATACFKLTQASEIQEKEAAIGRLDRETGRFEVDQQRVQELREQLDVTLPECGDCFNRFHCARQCPDYCPLDDSAGQGVRAEPGFRCLTQKLISLEILRETAEGLWAEVCVEGMQGPHGTTDL